VLIIVSFASGRSPLSSIEQFITQFNQLGKVYSIKDPLEYSNRLSKNVKRRSSLRAEALRRASEMQGASEREVEAYRWVRRGFERAVSPQIDPAKVFQQPAEYRSGALSPRDVYVDSLDKERL
jgi:hypothetical protein